jgi:hypothetical protein
MNLSLARHEILHQKLPLDICARDRLLGARHRDVDSLPSLQKHANLTFTQ